MFNLGIKQTYTEVQKLSGSNKKVKFYLTWIPEFTLHFNLRLQRILLKLKKRSNIYI